MKVLMIVHGFPPECSGGTESYVLRLCRELMKGGHDVEVLCGSHEGAGPGASEPTVDRDRHQGIPVHRVHRTGLYVDNWEKGFAPEVLPHLDRVLESFRPDLVHVHHWIRLTRNLIEHCHDRGVPAVCTLHDLSTTCAAAFRVHDGRFHAPTYDQPACPGCPPPGEYLDGDQVQAEWELFQADFASEMRLARRVIVPSNAHRDLVARVHPLIGGRFRVVPHGNIAPFKPRAFRRPREEERFPGGPLVLGHWGHLSFAKGLDVLLEAMAALPDPGAVRAEIFGSVVYPGERPRIDALASGLQVTWRGPYRPRDLKRIPMDLAVIPTRCSESWSFVLDEAFLLGLPAVVPDRGALPERLEGAGSLFRPGDPRDLARALQEVLEDPSLLRTWGRRIPGLLPMAEHARRMERVYREVVSSSAPLPTAPMELRDARVAWKTRLLEMRNRDREEDEARLGQLRSDLETAQRTMDQMDRGHREKDRVIAGLQERVRDLEAKLEDLRREAQHLQELRERVSARKERLRAVLGRGRELQQKLHDLEGDLRSTLQGVAQHTSASQEGAAGLGGVLDAEHSGEEPPGEFGKEPLDLLEAALDGQQRMQDVLERRNTVIRRMGTTIQELLDQLEALERRRRAKTRPAAVLPGGGRRLRILMVVHQFLPRHVAGTELYTFNLARELSRRHEVAILAAESDHDRPRFEESRHEMDGLRVHQMIHNYRWESFRDTYDCPEADAAFRRVLRAERPDIVHIQHLHHFSANFVTIARAKGIPVVFTLHDYMLLCPREGIMRRADGEICMQPVPGKCRDCIQGYTLSDTPAPPIPRGLKPGAEALVAKDVMEVLRRTRPGMDGEEDPHARAVAARLDYLARVLRDVDLFIAPSRFLQQRFLESGLIPAERIIHSDNGLDLTGRPPATPRRLPPGERLRAGYVGTLAEHKGVHVLVEAMNLIEDERVHCMIWGDLKAFTAYTERIREAIRNPRTLLMGPFPNSRVQDVLAGLDVLVVPSLWFENAPLTIREAALAGLPVIASDLGGMAESVKPGVTGLLVPPDDPGALARALLDCLKAPGPLAGFDPAALPVKSIQQDARDMEARYRKLLRRVPAGV